MRHLALLLAVSSCTAIADFPEDRLNEATEALCGNTVDDDLDGLSDCQDWKCQGFEHCCTIPAIVLEDDFSSDSCGQTPDDARWERWGAPYPYLCEGRLVIDKPELCYPVGVQSRATVTLEPGFRIESDVEGVPEPAAHLSIGLTTSSLVVDAADPCTPLAPTPTLFAVVFAPAPDGQVRFVATIEDEPIAELVADPDVYEIAMYVTEDRTVVFTIDDEIFARSREVLPSEPPVEAHVILRGLGSAARFESVTGVEGTQCDRPLAWSRRTPFAPIDPPPGELTWDALARGFPNARVDDAGALFLTYTGCQPAAGSICDPYTYAVGQASAAPGGALERPDTSLFSTDMVSEGDNYPVIDYQVIGDQAIFGIVPFGTQLGIVDVDTDGLPTGTPEWFLGGVPGAWDLLVSRPSVLDHGETRFVWYTAQGYPEQRSRIAVATTLVFDDLFPAPYTRAPAPALDLGDVGSYDARGVEDPTVVYDQALALFRMWYGAVDSVGRTTIAYAVSTDGFTWAKFPGNPILRANDLDLLTIASPTVLEDEGRLRMWVHGTAAGASGTTIYELENLGEPFVSSPPP